MINVLIVDGFSNHDWAHTTRCIRAILNAQGGIDVSVSTYPADETEVASWRPQFDAYDVVIQTCNDLGGGPDGRKKWRLILKVMWKMEGGFLFFTQATMPL